MLDNVHFLNVKKYSTFNNNIINKEYSEYSENSENNENNEYDEYEDLEKNNLIKILRDIKNKNEFVTELYNILIT